MELRIITYNTHGLPWSRDRSKEISKWLSTQGADILCLQEVFTQKARDIFVKFLNRHGYEVCIPDDSGVTLLGSGLLTCFKIAKFQLLSHVFCSFQQYHNVEWFANKGFHCVRLKGTHTIAILNTHTQSNTEVSFLFGKKVIHEIRAAQFEQMYNFSRGLKSRVLIVGDVNCDISPFHGVRFLSFIHNNLFHKNRTKPVDFAFAQYVPFRERVSALFCYCYRRRQAYELYCCPLCEVVLHYTRLPRLLS